MFDPTSVTWHVVHKRRRSPFINCITSRAGTTLKTRIGVDYRMRYLAAFDDIIAVDRESWERLAKRLELQIRRDCGWFYQAMASFEEAAVAGRRLWARLRRVDVASTSSGELAEMVDAYADSLTSFGMVVTWPPVLDPVLSALLRAELERVMPNATRAADAFETATDPISAGTTLEEDRALTRIADALRRGDDVDDHIAKHTREFGWMKDSDFWGAEHGEAYFARRIRKRSTKDPGARLEELAREQRRKRQRLVGLLAEVGEDTFVGRIVRLANASVHFRSYRSDVFRVSFGRVSGLLKGAARRLDVDGRDLLCLYPEEISDALRGRRASSIGPLVRSRKAGSVFVGLRSGGYFDMAGSAAAKLTKQLFLSREPVRAWTSLRGEGASPGKATGRAVIVHSTRDLPKVRRGDILVAHATNVDYLEALERAAGFVTEEGGILCHAAVISRELKLPAVVGTGIATSVIRPNDLVEIDGLAGIVRRVQRGGITS